MEKLKWIWITLGVVLFATLSLCVTSVVLICNVANESKTAAETVSGQIEVLKKQLDEIESVPNAPIVEPSDKTETDSTDVDADILYDVFCVRETNGKIGIYTEEGYLIRTLNVNVATLPAIDREKLSDGIAVNSWRELISLIEDYEG